jgi:hypothetical protein
LSLCNERARIPRETADVLLPSRLGDLLERNPLFQPLFDLQAFRIGQVFVFRHDRFSSKY